MKSYLYKTLLNSLLIALYIVIPISGYKLFTQQTYPLAGSITFLIMLLIFLFSSRIYKRDSWRKPKLFSMTLVIILALVVFAFAGVEPFSKYKNNIFERISSTAGNWSFPDVPMTDEKYTQKSAPPISLFPTSTVSKPTVAEVKPSPTLVLPSTPTSTPQLTREQLIQYTLDLINADRKNAGIAPITLGTNTAAQAHAEEMLKNGYLSHWGLDGLKPYMRYTLAGGANYEAENGLASKTYVPESGSYTKRDIKVRLEADEKSFMASPGHRDNILNKWHKKVSIGLSYNSVTEAIVQQFEGDYITYNQKPLLSNGVLSFSGHTSGGLVVDGVQIWYDQSPHPLTLGQLGQTYAYNAGIPTAFIRPPASPNYYYSENEVKYTWQTQGPDPYLISPNTAPPESNPFIVAIPPPILNSATVKWLDARQWNIVGSSFAVVVDLNPIVSQFGKGVYTVRIWAKFGTEEVELTNYSIIN